PAMGLLQARCVEVELDTPSRAWEGRVPSRPWGCCKLAVSRWNSTLPVAPGRAGFHPGRGVCGKLAVSRWNSTGSRSTLLVALDIPGLHLAHRSTDPRAIVPPQHLADPLSGPHQLFNIHPGINPHAVEHIEHILTGHVAAGAPGVGAAAQPGDGTVEHADAFQQGSVDIALGLAVGVMEVSGQLFAGQDRKGVVAGRR